MKIYFSTTLKRLTFFTVFFITALAAIKYFNIQLPAQLSRISLSDKSNSLKQQRWQDMEKEVNSWGDALGLGIDPGIKKTVIVLNLLGFKTEQSCEGHIDWGLPYPWISFATEDTEINALRSKGQDIFKRIEEKESAIGKKYPGLSLADALRKETSEDLYALYKERREAYDKIEKLSKLKLAPLNNLVADFYKKHSIDPDKMLAFGELDRLYSLGGYWQIIRNDSEKRKKLQEYQQEMQLFTDFLTDYYYRT